MNVTWRVPPDVDAADLIRALTVTVLPWCTHGLSIVALINSDPTALAEGSYNYYGGYIYDVREPIILSVKTLHCHPYVYQLTGAVGQFFSWVSVCLTFMHT